MRDLTPCCICGSSASSVVYEATCGHDLRADNLPNPFKAHYRVNRCAGCQLQYSSPILDEEGVRALYDHGVSTKTEDFSGTNVATGETAGVRRTMELYYDTIRPWLRAKEAFVDVGCDVGYLLDAALKDGFKKAFGCEPNPLARERAAALPGATISDLYYEHWDLPRNSFDGMALIHVLDHLVDPMSVLKKAHLELKPGGIVFAVVHNVECLLAKLSGERFPPFCLYHHYFFSKRTLEKLLKAAGFEVIRVVNTRNCYSLGFFLEKVPWLPGRQNLLRLLAKMNLTRLNLTIPIGNMGILGRKPATPS